MTKEQQRAKLHKNIWRIANDLRGTPKWIWNSKKHVRLFRSRSTTISPDFAKHSAAAALTTAKLSWSRQREQLSR